MIVLAAQLALAAVLAVAATAKLADDSGAWRASLAAFGVPSALAPAVYRALPLVELGLAAGLMAGPAARVAAAGALALLAGFSAAVAVTLARGRRPDCLCFGSRHARPIHAGTLARNVALTGLAAVALLGEAVRGAPAWAGGVVLAGGTAAVWVLRRRRKARPGRPAPAFALPDRTGAVVRLADLRARGAPVLLVFSSPTCPACRRLLPRIATWQRDHPDVLTVALISAEPPDPAHERGPALFDPAGAVAAAYGVRGTPTGVLVGRDGTLGAVALGEERIAALVQARTGVRPRATLTRRRTLQLAGAGALAGGSAAWLGAAAAPSAGQVCRQPELGRCTGQAGLRTGVATALCRFEPPGRRSACRRRARARLAALERECRRAYCACADGTVPCGSQACCGPGERCDGGACVPVATPPAPTPTPRAGPCAGDSVTLESLLRASAELEAGSGDVALSPAGCLRYQRTVANGAVASETFTAEGRPFARFTHTAGGSAGEQDADFDGFFEWHGTLRRGQDPSVSVEILEYSPLTRQLARRRRRTVSGTTVHSVWEEDDGGGLRTVAEFDSPTYQELRPAALRSAAAAAGGLTIDPSCADIAGPLRDSFERCTSQVLPCLHEKGMLGVEAEMSKLITGGVTIFCEPLSGLAVFNNWSEHPFTPGARMTIDPVKFERQIPNVQLALPCHELMHGTSLGEHDPSLMGSNLPNLHETDRITACTDTCFPTPLTTRCSCATCIGSTVCDSRCEKFNPRCECDLPAKCLCPFNTRWYARRSECEADCPRGLRCFGFTRCAGKDVCCR